MTRERGKSAQRGSEMLAALEAMLADALRTRLPGYEADRLAMLATERVRVVYGGQLLYIPMDRIRRDAAIVAAFTGDNHHDLAAQFHVSTNTIYKVLREDLARRTHKQGSLLDVG